MTCPEEHYCPTCFEHLEGRYTEVTQGGNLYDHYLPCGHETLRSLEDLSPEDRQLALDAMAIMDEILLQPHRVSAEELMDHPDLASLNTKLESIWKGNR